MKYYESGWIIPDGTYKTVSLHSHYSDLFNDKKALKFIEFASYKELETWADEKYREAQYEWMANLEPDEHPCWHAFNLYPSDLIAESVYEAGFIRCNIFINDFSELEMEAEGDDTPNEIFIKKIMNDLSINKCIFRSRRYSSKNKVFKINEIL